MGIASTRQGIITSLAGLLIALIFSITIPGQSNRGTITGTVVDAHGGVIPNAGVSVVNVSTQGERLTTTNSEGAYTVPSLEPGQYKVTVTAGGFQTVVHEQITLQTNDRLAVDVTLPVGDVGTQTMTITSEVPLVNSESSVRGDVITGRQVTELPIPQRNFTILATLVPGVTRPAVGTLGGGGNFVSGGVGESTESTRFRESGGSVLSVNGARVTNNNFTLDGVDNNESQFGQIGIFPNPDAIAEFKVETSVPSADSGRAGGAIISTTFKSGTNNFHGSAYEFYQGQFASARPANNPNPQNFVTHNYGLTFGGPVGLLPRKVFGPIAYDGRNKTFFFFSFNGQRNAQPINEFQFVTVPTARMRAGDFSELLSPGQTQAYKTVSGTKVAPLGTIFDAQGNPFPGNLIPPALFSRAAFNLLNAYPLPTEAGRENNYRRNRAQRYDLDGYDIKIDQHIKSSNILFGRYSNSESGRARQNNWPVGSSPTGDDLPAGFGAGNEFGNSRQVALGDTQTFSPSVVNDLRGGYTRVNIGIANTGVTGIGGFDPNISAQVGIPNINVCGDPCSGMALIGVADGLVDKSLEFVGDGGPFYFLSNNFYLGDSLTVVRGNQTLKFGGDLRVRQNSNFDGGRAGDIKGQVQYGTGVGGFLSGNYSGIIGPDDSGSSYANLLLGYRPALLNRGTPGGPYLLSNKELAFYVQDDWKVRPDLTLNVGLRYDIFTPQTERYDRQTNFDPATGNLIPAAASGFNGRGLAKTDKNNLGPRIGIAYSGFKKNKTFVVRGGYGILYSPDVSGQQPLTINPPNGSRYDCSLSTYGTASCPQLSGQINLDTGYPFPPLLPASTTPFPAPTSGVILYLNPDVRSELFHQYNATLQYEFRPNWLAEVGYVGSLGRNLLVVQNIGSSATNGPGSRQVKSIDQVIETGYSGSSSYNALQTKLEKRFSEGLSIISSYTWSHAIDDSPGGFPGQSLGPNRYGFQNPLQPGLDRASSDLDIRHRWNFANIWDVPFGHGRKFGAGIPTVLDAVVGGLQFNNNVTIQSGPVFTVNWGGPRPDLIGDPRPTAAQEAQGLEFNPFAFGPPRTPIFPGDPPCDFTSSAGCFGNVGRNTLRGSSQYYWDASVFKNFRISKINEAANLQVRVQAYNLLNHVNRFVPNHNVQYSAQGVLTDSNAGKDLSVQRPRQLEFSLKLIF